MKNWNWSIIIAALIIAGAIIFYGLSQRFYIDTSTKMKVDKLTGETFKYNSTRNEWVRIDQSDY